MMGDGMMDGGMMGGMMLLWVVFVLVLLALAVTALIWLIRQLRRPSSPGRSSAGAADAREELDRRYATGELAREDYLRAREDIRS